MTKTELAKYLAQKYFDEDYDDEKRSSWYLVEFQSWRGGAFFDGIGKERQWGKKVNESWNKYNEDDGFNLLLQNELKELLEIT